MIFELGSTHRPHMVCVDSPRGCTGVERNWLFAPLSGRNPLRLATYEGPRGIYLLAWFGNSDKCLRLFVCP